MFASAKLKSENIVGYLLYMWQVEDIIRANSLDVDKITESYVERFQLNDEQRVAMVEWYSFLVEMMRGEGVVESGHLQINKNMIILLTDLHNELLKSSKYPFYSAAYYKVLPFIVEIRNKSNGKDKSEIENCFDAIYGLTTMRMKKVEISAETLSAVGEITRFLGMLADYYKKDIAGELVF
jgi:hypothetical protein